MKKLFTILFLSLFCFSLLSAEREVVILTSINNPKAQPFWRSKNYEISKDIESQFKNVFNKSGYKVIYNHKANREILSYYLSSPNTVALFWVSHAADESEVKGMSFSSVIQDIDGNNVKNLFQKINPNLKFLSIIGCSAKKILEGFKEKGFFHSDLSIHAFDKKIRLNRGIDEAITASAEILDEDASVFKLYQYPNSDERSYSRNFIVADKTMLEVSLNENSPKQNDGMISISVINKNPEFSAELNINDHFIGVLKKGLETQTFTIPRKLVSPSIKLKIDYDLSSLKLSKYLEPLDISLGDLNLSVDYLKDKEGRPYGRGTNFYYIKSNSQL